MVFPESEFLVDWGGKWLKAGDGEDMEKRLDLECERLHNIL